MSTRSALLPTASAVAPSIDVMRVGVAVFAAVDLATALFMALAPHAFYKSIGPFDVYNAHYLRDVATFEAAFGIGLAVAVARPAWRVPMLAASTVQYLLHSLNHLLDIDSAHPAWSGYADFGALLAGTVALLWLLRQALARQSPGPTPVPPGGSR